MSAGNRPSLGNLPNRVSGIDQLGRMGSEFGKISNMCNISSGALGKGAWELLLQLSQENIWFDRCQDTTRGGPDVVLEGKEDGRI